MISPRPHSRPLILLLALAIFVTPLAGQKPTPAGTGAPSPTKPSSRATAADDKERPIESLLAVDSYKVYGEVKNVGALVHTGAFADIIDPVLKLADPPKEFKTLVKFVNTNADTLANARLIFATWPAHAGLPNAFFVIELASAEDAAQFEPKLNQVLPIILPTPTPSPTSEPGNDKPSGTGTETGASPKPVADSTKIAAVQPAPEKPVRTEPPFVVSRSRNLIFITDRPFKFESLRPAESKLLSEDQNFRQARERFSTEPVFLFINVALNANRISPEEKEAQEQDRKKAEVEVQAITSPDITPAMEEQPMPDAEDTPEVPGTEPPTVIVATGPTINRGGGMGPGPASPPPAVPPQPMIFGSMMSLLGAGEPEWPDAVGVAIAQEGDDYVIRSILVGPQNGKRLVLPFVTQLLAGRSLTPRAPSVLPDDTEVFVSASFDWGQTYEKMLERMAIFNKEHAVELQKRPTGNRKENDEKPHDPFADFEKLAGFRIKDDLLPALGNEISVASSMKALQGAGPFGMMAPPPAAAKAAPDAKQTEAEKLQKERDQKSAPVVLIAVTNREAARLLMPKVIAGLGIGAANMIGTKVKIGDSEMTDFAGALAYAFVEDFLVISTTPTVRHLIESNNNHQTLASNSAFRDFTRWQPSNLVGQIYVSPALMDSYLQAAHDPKQTIAAAMREYLLRLNPTPQPITYALSNEGYGAVHELHLPKTLVLASVAGAASATKNPPPERNESFALGMLYRIVSAEEEYRSTTGKGSYASLDKLIEAKLISREVLDKYGYRFEISVTGDQFQATATPVEYGTGGKLSYFVDQTGIVRGGDHGGGAASVADNPLY